MTHGQRTRRVLKWVGATCCVLLAIVWSTSGWYRVQFNGPGGTWAYRTGFARGTFFVWDAHTIARDVKEARQALAELREMGMADAVAEGEQILGPLARTFVIQPVPARRLSDRFIWWSRPATWPTGSVRIPLWLLVLGVAVPTAVCWWRDRRRFSPGHCQKCSYDLTGNISGRCPECGAACRPGEDRKTEGHHNG